MFNYNGIEIISFEEIENGQYLLTSETGCKYIVYKEEIIDNL